METTLTKEMLELIAQLGALVKNDARCAAIEHTIEDYEHSEELNALIGEYNAQQNLLADAFAKGDELTDEVRTAIQNRIDTLYEQIVNHPVYVAYVEAKNAFDALTTEIFGELQFVITGQRPCSHDCSSCHSNCSHNH